MVVKASYDSLHFYSWVHACRCVAFAVLQTDDGIPPLTVQQLFTIGPGGRLGARYILIAFPTKVAHPPGHHQLTLQQVARS